MTRTRIVFAVSLGVAALALAGCGGSSNNEAASTTTESTTQTTGSGTTGTSANTKLIGTVGEEANPDAFSITLTTADGKDVTTLAAGAYTLEIKDLSTIHNFHLTGPGNVDVSSDVGSTEDKEVPITLVAGDYHYQCDPHASSMNGDFTVTG
jgi:plastocyanin